MGVVCCTNFCLCPSHASGVDSVQFVYMNVFLRYAFALRLFLLQLKLYSVLCTFFGFTCVGIRTIKIILFFIR